jgi:pimeloyl-ACP methyl ester carboxylesterase
MSGTSDRAPAGAPISGELHWEVMGDGAPLLYLADWEQPRWTAALQELARTFRVYLPDLPGWGLSGDSESMDAAGAARVLASLLPLMAPEGRAHLVGTARGAAIALWLAALHPELVERLVVCEPPALLPAGSPPPDSHAGSRTWDQALYDRLPALEAPVLALFGTRDRQVPGDAARAYRERLPHCYVTYVYNAGHDIAGDRPEAFARLTAEFLTYGEGFVRNRGSTGYMRAPPDTRPTGGGTQPPNPLP